MSKENQFTAVGENIHCTRVLKAGGKYVNTLENGLNVIAYNEHDSIQYMPVPESFINCEDWRNGKLKHISAALHQGMYGTPEEQKAGISYLQYCVKKQEDAGADFIDLNVDEFSTNNDEKKNSIAWLVKIVQTVTSLPLSIDSSNTQIIKEGLSACNSFKRKAMVNSVSLERFEAVKTAKDAGAAVIAGASGESSMPATKEERVHNITELVRRLKAEGFDESGIYIDPLIFPVSVNSQNGIMILDTIKELRDNFGGYIHFAPGLSNVSFGLPKRKLLNMVFTYLCIKNGLDGGIVDPLQINKISLENLDEESKPFIMAKDLLLGKDDFGMDFITAVREGKI